MRHSSFFSDIWRAISWHRRKLAVVAAVAAVVTGISAATPPAAPTTTVVVARIGLAGGAQLGATDLEARALPPSAVPDEAVTDPQAVVGRTLLAPLPAGSVLTALSVLSPRAVTRPGEVIAPVRISDASVVGLLRVGDRIDVVVNDGQTQRSSILARNVRVVTLPQARQTSSLGATGADSTNADSQLVLLAVTETQATALTRATGSQIGVILH